MIRARNDHPTLPRVTALAAGLALAFGSVDIGAANSGPAFGAHTPRVAANSNRDAFVPVRLLRTPGQHNRNRVDAQPSAAAAGSRSPGVRAVINCDDAGPGSLRDELAAAASGDTIDLTGLDCATITLTSGRLYTNLSELTLQGPGRDALTIDGGAADLVFEDRGSALTIKDLTIANGHNALGYGGCIYASGDLVLSGSRVTGCEAGDGSNAGAYGSGVDVLGNLELVSSTISGNTGSAADGRVLGGGAYVGGNATLSDGSSIEGNVATGVGSTYARGGGLFAQGNVQVIDSAVTGNTATAVDGTAYGGGIHANGGLVEVTRSLIHGNTAHSTNYWSYGGGIQSGDGLGAVPGGVSLAASTISGNATTADCGACFIQGGGAHAFGVIESESSTIRDNIVQSASASNGVARGGGLATFGYGYYGNLYLVNSTVSGNSALGGGESNGVGYGGGVVSIVSSVYGAASTLAFNHASHVGGGAAATSGGGYVTFLYSTLVANNTAPADADLAPVAYAVDPLTVSGDHNLVTVASANVTLPGDTLSDDPLLVPLANNGGPTATHELPACSPAIDQGDNSESLDFDQRGDPYLREFGSATDIGAFERQPDAERIFANGFDASPCP